MEKIDFYGGHIFSIQSMLREHGGVVDYTSTPSRPIIEATETSFSPHFQTAEQYLEDIKKYIPKRVNAPKEKYTFYLYVINLGKVPDKEVPNQLKCIKEAGVRMAFREKWLVDEKNVWRMQYGYKITCDPKHTKRVIDYLKAFKLLTKNRFKIKMDEYEWSRPIY